VEDEQSLSDVKVQTTNHEQVKCAKPNKLLGVWQTLKVPDQSLRRQGGYRTFDNGGLGLGTHCIATQEGFYNVTQNFNAQTSHQHLAS
jgi:hypothetical protein